MNLHGKNGKHNQLSRATSGMLDYGAKLGTGAKSVGLSALHQMQEAAEKTKDAVFPSKKTLLGLGILSQLLSKSKEDDVRSIKLTRKNVSDDFIEAVASGLEKRLTRSDDFRRALAKSLREEVPRLRRLPKERSSKMGWLTTLGLVVAAGYGLNYLLSQYSRQDMMNMASDQMNNLQDKVKSYTSGGQSSTSRSTMGSQSSLSSPGQGTGTRYRDVQRTSGAEMPNPDVHAGSGVAAREKASGETITGKTSIRTEPEDLGSKPTE